jgi:hypothetical protein
VTSLSPAKGERMQKAQVKAGDLSGLLSRFALLQSKCWLRTKHDYPLVVIQEAGLDLFLPSWRFTVLQQLKGVGPTSAAILCRKDFSDTLTIEDSCPPTRPDAHTLAERIDLTRARDIKGRQCPNANDDGPAQLALAEAPTPISAGTMVSRPNKRFWRSEQAGGEHRPRSKTTGQR